MSIYFRRVISASLSPNTEFDDILTAWRVFVSPWRWVKGSAVRRVELWFAKTFHTRQVLSFNSGRSALYGLLRAFDIGDGDEVLVQAFTCVAVPNSVLWTGAKPVYVDIDNTLNINVTDAEKKYTKRTKAIIVQHTLGNPADMKAVLDFSRVNKILVIEDCAHSLGASFEGKQVGTFGDGAFFSFGRDKVVSSVFGGVAVISEHHKDVWDKLKAFHNTLSDARVAWILQQVFHPIAFSVILPLYGVGIGRLLLAFWQKMKWLSFPVYGEEKKGKRPALFPAKYPNALAELMIRQLTKLNRYNRRRQESADRYSRILTGHRSVQPFSIRKGSINMRFPVTVDNPSRYLAKAKKHGVLLGNWYHNTIDPVGVDFAAIGYIKGSCPKAEDVADHIINLPTNIRNSELMRVIQELL